MGKMPYLRFYVGDALSDEDLMGLSMIAFGAWMKVLFMMWKAQSGTIRKPRKTWENNFNCTPETLDIVLDELLNNDVGHVEHNEQHVTFRSTRLQSEVDRVVSDRDRKRAEKDTSAHDLDDSESIPKPFRNNSARRRDNDNDNKSSKKGVKRFCSPSIDDVKAHFEEKGSNNAEAENFYLYYDSIGWVVGRAGKQMKNWKSAATRWVRNAVNFKPTKSAHWAKPEVTTNRVRSCIICGKQATHSYGNDCYCEQHDQYTKAK